MHPGAIYLSTCRCWSSIQNSRVVNTWWGGRRWLVGPVTYGLELALTRALEERLPERPCTCLLGALSPVRHQLQPPRQWPPALVQTYGRSSSPAHHACVMEMGPFIIYLNRPWCGPNRKSARASCATDKHAYTIVCIIIRITFRNKPRVCVVLSSFNFIMGSCMALSDCSTLWLIVDPTPGSGNSSGRALLNIYKDFREI